MTLTLDSGTTLEHAIVRRMIASLSAAGWALQAVNDGGDEVIICETTDKALEHVFSVMDSTVLFQNGSRRHWVRLIVGNDRDIISDHSVSTRDDFNATMTVIAEQLEMLSDEQLLQV